MIALAPRLQVNSPHCPGGLNLGAQAGVFLRCCLQRGKAKLFSALHCTLPFMVGIWTRLIMLSLSFLVCEMEIISVSQSYCEDPRKMKQSVGLIMKEQKQSQMSGAEQVGLGTQKQRVISQQMVSPAQDCSKWVPGSPPWESEALLKCIVIAGIFLLFLILIQRNAFSILLLNVSSFAGCVYLNNLYHVKDIPFYPLFPRIFPPLISNKFFFLSCIF